MGIIERKARHNLAVKKGILQAARTLAIEKGWSRVNIRDIAKLIEYSPPVIYQHFTNKAAVLRQLQIDGFEMLRKKIAIARETAFEPELQLTNISVAYWRFSSECPEMYQVMFNLEGVFVNSKTTTAELKRAGKPAMEILFSMSDSPEELEELFLNWWAIVHGYISITMTQALPVQRKENREAYLRRAITRFITSVKYTSGR